MSIFSCSVLNQIFQLIQSPVDSNLLDLLYTTLEAALGHFDIGRDGLESACGDLEDANMITNTILNVNSK